MQLKAEKKYFLVLLLALLLMPLIYSQTPELHALQGYIFSSDNSQVPAGTKVRINATTTGTFLEVQTSGPPGHSGFYSTTINAISGETVIVTSLNKTHYGRNSTSLLPPPSTTLLNLILNNTRPAETQLDIISPQNNAVLDRFQVFNLIFNVTAIGGQDSNNCNTTLTIANPSIINITSNEIVKSLGNIPLGTSKESFFELIALSDGSTTITLKSSCSSDEENFENLNSKTINLSVTDQPAQLHAIQGYIFHSDSITQVPSGTNVTINLTRTSQLFNVKTSGPPGHSGFYSINIYARDNDEIIVYSQNNTHEGNTSKMLLPSPSVTRINVSLDTKKPVDLMINSSSIVFSEESPIERTNITINSTISNFGRGDAFNIVVETYKNGELINNITIPLIQQQSSITIQSSFINEAGPNNLFVYVDPPTETNGSIQETNETNNQANNTIHVVAWQEFFGNITLDKRLSSYNNSNLSIWHNQTSPTGNIFITDSEAQISWSSLQALGRNASGSSTTNDFANLDYLLNMTSFRDSVSNRFTSDGIAPLATANFTVHNKEILSAPIINSTNSSNFITGILWDTTKDTDGEFSIEDKEDIVFVTKVNSQTPGAFGIYDYEITIPVKIREYYTEDTKIVYIYYDLV